MNEKINGHISALFCSCRLVKADAVAAIGAFKSSSTIDALCNFIDEEKEGLFPSVSSVC
jgi:hypothetical protein